MNDENYTNTNKAFGGVTSGPFAFSQNPSGILTSSVIPGLIIGSLCASLLANRLGRKASLFSFANAFMIVGTLGMVILPSVCLSSATMALWVLVGSRFVVGIGAGCVQVSQEYHPIRPIHDEGRIIAMHFLPLNHHGLFFQKDHPSIHIFVFLQPHHPTVHQISQSGSSISQSLLLLPIVALLLPGSHLLALPVSFFLTALDF